MIFGYCRISTPNQSIERQVRNIKALYPNATVIKEVYTGTSMDRPEFKRLLNKLSKGDTIVFDSVSRMSRNKGEGIKEYFYLYDQNIDLIFLKEPHINTSVYRKALELQLEKTGTAVDHILAGIDAYRRELAKQQIAIAFDQAEKEVMDIRQRTSEGMQTAKLNGARIGQPKGILLKTKKSIICKQEILNYSKDYGGPLSDTAIIRMTGVSKKTYYKYKKELKNEQGRS